MNQPEWKITDEYLEDLFIPDDPALAGALASSEAAGLPAIQVSPIQGKFLHLLARAMGARNILEIGTLGAYSTIWLARALPLGGQLVTLEYVPQHAEVALANIRRAGLADVVELLPGDALETLPRLAAENRQPFDLIFIDADKESYPDYLKWSLKLTRVGGLIIADNVVRSGAVASATSEDPRVQAVRRFNDMLAAEPRVTATTLQTVGAKGYDGFAIALVTSL